MQTIQTKYLPATNFKGYRIKAWCERGSITISYDSALNMDNAHIACADALVAKFVKEDAARYGEHPNPWQMPRVFGTTSDGIGCHVFCPIRADVRKGDAVHINRNGAWKLCTVLEGWHGKGNAWLSVKTAEGTEMSVALNSSGELV